ncbi:hypothetical protein OPIT5_00155 (plasmid) [Opitutaceae bacterium TAV5]|nr:hypothetical protein OPIT5_00155 [Opitutaceae bacterium TAV5]
MLAVQLAYFIAVLSAATYLVLKKRTLCWFLLSVLPVLFICSYLSAGTIFPDSPIPGWTEFATAGHRHALLGIFPLWYLANLALLGLAVTISADFLRLAKKHRHPGEAQP